MILMTLFILGYQGPPQAINIEKQKDVHGFWEVPQAIVLFSDDFRVTCCGFRTTFG